MKFISLFVINLAALYLAANHYGVTFNISPSVPLGIYVDTGADSPSRGDYISFCLPDDVSKSIVETFKLSQKGGACGGYPKLVKRVEGIPNDTVVVSLESVVVNGHVIPNTPRSVLIGSTHPWPTFSDIAGVVSDEKYFVLGTSHADSIDSRYYGTVAGDSILRVLKPLWTL